MEKIFKYIAVLHLLLISVLAPAQTIGLRVADSSMVQGQLINIPVYADSLLTGRGIYSFQIQLDYYDYYLRPVEVITLNTISQQFGGVTTNLSTTGKITVAGAGAQALTGKGVLFYIRFEPLKPGGVYVSFTGAQNNYFNEGSPLINFESGYQSIAQAPTIYISPNSGNLLLGDSLLFTVSGDTVGPFTYSLTNNAVGTISNKGFFKGTWPGKTKVTVTDAESLTATTSSNIEVFGYRLSSPANIKQWQGGWVNIPVNITDVSGLGITAGTFDFNFNASILTYDTILADTTMLSNASIVVNNANNGSVTVSFASPTALTGSGALVYLRFKVSAVYTGSSSLWYSNMLFNESLPGLFEYGYFTTINFETLYISPYSGNFYAGDSVQLSVTGGVKPYTYQTTNTQLAEITNTGMLHFKKGGVFKVTVSDSVGSQSTSGNFTVFDTYVEIPDTTGPANNHFLLPVYIGNVRNGANIFSLQTAIDFRSPHLEFVGIVTTGTLCNGWSLAHSINGGTLTIAGAGTQGINTSGILFYIEFNLTSSLAIGDYSWLNFTSLMLNEGSPNAITYNGSITATKSEDLGIASIISPQTGCSLTANEPLTVTVRNFGYVTYPIGDTITVAFSINWGLLVVDTIILESPLIPGASLTYTFDSTLNMEQFTSYYLSVKTMLSSEIDGHPSNDGLAKYVYNYQPPTLNLGSDYLGCSGDTVHVNVVPGYSSYTWWNGLTDTTSVEITESTLVWLTVTNTYGCETTDTIQITLNPIPPKPIITVNNSAICAGDSAILTAPLGYDAYYWNGVLGSESITVYDAISVSVMVADSIGCSSETSDTVFIEKNPIPVANFEFTINGQNVDFNNLSVDVDSYVWNFGDGNTSTQPNPSHTYASNQVYEVSLTASNANCGDSVITKTVAIGVNGPPTIDAQTFTLAENSVFGTLVGTVMAGDPNNDALSFSIVSGNTNSAFALNSNSGQLSVANAFALDFELNPVFVLEVSVSDGTLSASANVTINLTDVDESQNNLPVINNQTFNVDENSPAEFTVGTVLASDADSDVLHFFITNGNTLNAFVLGELDGVLKVNNTLALDFETTPTFSLNVQVTDGKGTAEATVTVSLNDVDESQNNVPVINAQSFSLDENSPAEFTIGTVLASDADSDVLHFFITNGNTLNAFVLGELDGVLKVNNTLALDFETTPTFSLNVQVSDGKGTAEAIVTVTLNNVNEGTNQGPTMIDQFFNIAENTDNETLVGTILADDPDSDPLQYSILSGNTNNAFRVNLTNGQLFVNNSVALDFEVIREFNLTIQVFDGELSAQANAKITIDNVNETGIFDNNTSANKWLVYPNPAINTIYLKELSETSAPNISVKWFGLDGREILLAEPMISSQSANLQWNIQHLPNGTYFVRITSGTFTQTSVVVKQ